jgi:peptide-methionine (S)-S-oxide reductase
MKMLIRTYGIVFFLLATAATAFAQQPAFDMGDVPEGHAVAILAGGCFWCMEPPYDKMDGVVETISGYTGGSVANPTYRQVVRNNTGHYEAILLVYDPDTVSYEELLDTFWVNVDPLDAGGQFCDRGDSYRTGIFALDAKQRRAAEQSIRELDESDRLRFPVVTEVMDADTFYVAEEYHQDY